MASGEALDQAMIFDGFRDRTFVENSRHAVLYTGRKPLVFSKTFDAVGRFCDPSEGTIEVLITTLGIQEELFPSMKMQFPATPLIKIAHNLGKPVAVLSDHPYAHEHIVRGSADTVIPIRNNNSPEALVLWLGKLTAQV